MWDAENVKMFAYFRPDWHDNESHPISSGSTYNSRSSEVREAIYWFLVYCYCLGYFPANCTAGTLKHINYIHTNSWFWLWVERRNYFWVTLNGQLLSEVCSLVYFAHCAMHKHSTRIQSAESLARMMIWVCYSGFWWVALRLLGYSGWLLTGWRCFIVFF